MLLSYYLVEVTRGRVGLGLEDIGPLPGLGWLVSLHKGLDGLELSSVFGVSMVPMLGPYHLSLGKEKDHDGLHGSLGLGLSVVAGSSLS